MKRYLVSLSLLLTITCFNSIQAQGFLHTQGTKIVDGNGENFILRGIGTGNWMLMEGYMMKTVDVANTQTEFRTRLIETIGEALTDSFYNVWLNNHFTRRDVDSMKVWGYNSVRVAMHYKWFTPPIEDEPESGKITWLDKGFEMIDSLLDWCGDNEMYLILDLHGAPGGQGKDRAISDYDPSKPSLWESTDNKKKTIALWQKLASRYTDEPWIGGYDLINETNWTFPEGNNSQLRQLLGEITDSIRTVDSNHIIFIEGNSFANDHSGLTPPWDDNLVYSFHKYWNSNNANSLDWIIQLRNSYNVPLWLGESGENSNTWFTDLITLCENKNIGWSWWPVKKDDINAILNVKSSAAYLNLIRSWKGEIPAFTAQETFDAVMEWADNHKIENCEIQYDVIDAMIRQPFTDNVLPFKEHKLTAPIFCSEYDYGKNTIAYYDLVVDNTSMEFASWNDGWAFRNDGVDIESCTDTKVTNGYSVGWTETEEWMLYSLASDSAANYTLNIRHASGGSGSIIHLEVNDVNVSGSLTLPSTGGWSTWQTTSFENINIPGGNIRLKLVFEMGGSNLNYFTFSNARSIDSVDFECLNIETSEDGYDILLSLNKSITTAEGDFNSGDFQLVVDNVITTVDEISMSENSDMILKLSVNQGLYSDQDIFLSYSGHSIVSGMDTLQAFTNVAVNKNMAESQKVPGKIQAEDFYINYGFELEDCSDTGNGLNTSYAGYGDFLVYKVHVTRSGYYRVIYRVATEKSNAEIKFQVGQINAFTSIDTMQFEATGGWQTWDVQTSEVYLDEGYYFIRLFVKQSEFNLNWFQLNFTSTAVKNTTLQNAVLMYPNPAKNLFTLSFQPPFDGNKSIQIMDLKGHLVYSTHCKENKCVIDSSKLKSGMYLVQVIGDNSKQVMKLLIE